MAKSIKMATSIIQTIIDDKGLVTAPEVVHIAKDEESPLHPYFEWDDKAAGHEYRLIQARQLLRRVRVEYDDKPVRLVHVNVSYSDDGDGDPGAGYYKPIAVNILSRDEYEAAHHETLQRLVAANESLDELQAVAPASGITSTRVRSAKRHVKSAISDLDNQSTIS